MTAPVTTTEPFTYIGFQAGQEGIAGDHLYNLNVDIVGKLAGSTVSGATLKAAGYTLPRQPETEAVRKDRRRTAWYRRATNIDCIRHAAA